MAGHPAAGQERAGWQTHIAVFIGPMKTTIDLPGELFREAKILAARRNTTFRELVIERLQGVKEHSGKLATEDRRAKAARLLAAL